MISYYIIYIINLENTILSI